MRFSVLISVCKNDNFVFFDKALKSIWFDQILKPDFIILVQDGKVNSSIQNIIQKYNLLLKKKLLIIRNKKNIGLTKSLNIGLKYCKTELIARMDSDDISHPDRFKLQVEFFKNNNCDILGTYSYVINENDKITLKRKNPIHDREIKNIMFLLNPITHPSVMMKTKKITQIGGYNNKFKTSQDYYLWLLSMMNELTFHNIPKYLIYYRITSSYSNKKNLNYRINDFKIKLSIIKKYKKPIYYYLYLLIPFIVFLIPDKLYIFFKKFDPR